MGSVGDAPRRERVKNSGAMIFRRVSSGRPFEIFPVGILRWLAESLLQQYFDA
ncbi:hypothetical protein AB0P17_24385 [Streptomyces sp. NPDC088124]|uniref:hypothetical protein n=1 Tax=Streptomyces sp. NPDC088124 TaxID=3154654 RepID=UPI003439D01B